MCWSSSFLVGYGYLWDSSCTVAPSSNSEAVGLLGLDLASGWIFYHLNVVWQWLYSISNFNRIRLPVGVSRIMLISLITARWMKVLNYSTMPWIVGRWISTWYFVSSVNFLFVLLEQIFKSYHFKSKEVISWSQVWGITGPNNLCFQLRKNDNIMRINRILDFLVFTKAKETIILQISNEPKNGVLRL